MKTLSLILLMLPLGCKGSSEAEGPLDTGGSETGPPADTAEESKDSGEAEDTDEPSDSSEPDDTETTPEAGPNARPDFSLTDVNSSSLTAGEQVSPRDYLEQVSGWYFTHAT